MSDFDEDMPDLPPLPGVSDEAGPGMKPGSEAAAGASVHDHLVMADDEGYHPHDPHAHHHLHEDPDGLHLGGEAKIDSVEAAIMAVATAGPHVGVDPPSPITATGRTRKITRSKPGQGLKQRARCVVEGCNKQSQGSRNLEMCRRHYIEHQKRNNPELAAEIVRELAMAGKKKRAQCSVEGCSKQSQGRVCNDMCRAHFVESGAEVSPSHRPRRVPRRAMPVEMPPLKPEPPKVRVTSFGQMEGERERHQYLCRVEGCTKQSQGARNNQMCRRHYTIYLQATSYNDGFDEANDVPEEPCTTGRRRTCDIPGCPKQSQGKNNLNMCRSHFRAMEKAGISTEELPQWQQSQSMEVALQADGADFAAAVDALPPLPDAEVPVAEAASAVVDVAAAAARHDNGDDEDHNHHFVDDDGDNNDNDDGDNNEVATADVSDDDGDEAHDDEEEPDGNDEELSLMIQREIQKLKKLERGEDCEEQDVEQYLGHNDDNNAEAALAASTAAANPPGPGPSPKRPRLENAGPPTDSNERALVKRRQQARDDVEALKAQLQAAQSKEITVMNAMEGMEECVLCQNEAKTVTMTPCGHSAICNHCAYDDHKCPICLEPIDPVDPIEEDGAVAV